MVCSLPGSSIPGIFQERILEWVAISSSKGSYWSRDPIDSLLLSHLGGHGRYQSLLISLFLNVTSLLAQIKTVHLKCRRPGFDPWDGKIPWRREWLPTPVFLPGEFHGQRSLAVYNPWGHKRRRLLSDCHTLNITRELLFQEVSLIQSPADNFFHLLLWDFRLIPPSFSPGVLL